MRSFTFSIPSPRIWLIAKVAWFMFSVIAALSLRIGCPDVPDAPLSVRLPKASPGRSKIKSSGPTCRSALCRGGNGLASPYCLQGIGCNRSCLIQSGMIVFAHVRILSSLKVVLALAAGHFCKVDRGFQKSALLNQRCLW